MNDVVTSLGHHWKDDLYDGEEGESSTARWLLRYTFRTQSIACDAAFLGEIVVQLSTPAMSLLVQPPTPLLCPTKIVDSHESPEVEIIINHQLSDLLIVLLPQPVANYYC